MRLSWTEVLFFFVTIFSCQAEELTEENESKTDSAVVYLIDTLDGKKTVIDESGKTRDASYILSDPIPFDKAGDGVYFRPSNGKPLTEPQVKIFI